MSDIPTSGAISLNQMHTEVGGTSGTQVSMNDSDIRGLISKASGATMSFNEWYGASSSLDSVDVTVGYKAAIHSVYAGPWYGFWGGGTTGSVSSTSVAWNSGASYTELSGQNPSAFGGNYQLKITISGGTYSNSGWTTVTVGGATYSRTSFFYGSSPSGQYWGLVIGTTSPFGTTVGATKTVVFN